MPRTLTPERCALRRLTGLTDRQLELLIAVASYALVNGGAVRANVAGQFLAERPHLAIFTPCPTVGAGYQRSYINATMRLLRLGYLRTRGSDERSCLLQMTPSGWAKIESLGSGSAEPPDILEAIGMGKGEAWERRPRRAVGT